MRIRVSLSAAILAALPGVAVAQFQPPPAQAPAQAQVQDRWPEMPPPSPSRTQQQRPAAAAPRTQQAAPQMVKPSDLDVEPPAPAAAPKPKAAASAPATGTAVACSGVFAKNSTHLKLAIKYNSRNIVYTDVDGPDGSKMKASVLYPNDPKRRLEVLWNNDASRSDTSIIAINGQSQWSAPKGVKLGMTIAALEKLNGRPFKLNGFGPDGSASIAGWEGGALAALPGGCKVGGRLTMDGKAPADARGAVAGDKELMSNDASLKGVKPTVAEILIGY